MMSTKNLQTFRDRTDSKLRYAKIHLDELKNSRIGGGSDFERAHQESFLYHLMGAKDAFLIELNEYYAAGLKGHDVSARTLKAALHKRGISSVELSELYELEAQEDSWLFHAKSIRNHSTHISNVPRHFHVGGQTDYVFISNPRTGKIIEIELLSALEDWLTKMTMLLLRLRDSAIRNTQL